MSKRVREVNRANVTASSRRLSRETAVVVDKRRLVKEAMDLEGVVAELKAHPERREAVRAQLEASVEPKYDSKVQFNPENVEKRSPWCRRSFASGSRSRLSSRRIEWRPTRF